MAGIMAWSSGFPAPRHLVAPLSAPCLLLAGGGEEECTIYDEVAALAVARGWRSTVVSLRQSTDQQTRREHLRLLTRAYDELVATDPPAMPFMDPPVWAIAADYSAYLVTLLSQRRPLARMLLRSPAVYADSDWDSSKAELDRRGARMIRHRELAPNDNLALCAASQYLGQVTILESESEEMALHGLHVDYFHAFSRASERSLTRLGHGRKGMQRQFCDDFRQAVDKWLATQP